MTDIYQAGTKAWEDIESWAEKSLSTSDKCFLELRSRIERLEKTLKEIEWLLVSIESLQLLPKKDSEK